MENGFPSSCFEGLNIAKKLRRLGLDLRIVRNCPDLKSPKLAGTELRCHLRRSSLQKANEGFGTLIFAVLLEAVNLTGASGSSKSRCKLFDGNQVM